MKVPFPVAAKVLEGRETVGLRTEDPGTLDPAADYVLVRLQQSELPQGAALEPGNYLVAKDSGLVSFRRYDGIGGDRLPAPQASLMATMIDGILDQKLPWDLILIGAAIAVFMELLGIGSLTFAVGLYLKVQYTMPVFLGGLVRKLADRRHRRVADAEDEPEGTLFSSGLIAGASILGIIAALQAFVPGFDSDFGLLPGVAFLMDLPFGAKSDEPIAHAVCALALVALGWFLFRSAAPREGGR